MQPTSFMRRLEIALRRSLKSMERLKSSQHSALLQGSINSMTTRKRESEGKSTLWQSLVPLVTKQVPPSRSRTQLNGRTFWKSTDGTRYFLKMILLISSSKELAMRKIWQKTSSKTFRSTGTSINNPDKKIEEDGIYGPKTEEALKSTPIEGFKK